MAARLMKLDSSNSPVYFPQSGQETVLRLGFENCAKPDWIYPAIDLKQFYRHKLALRESMGDRCYAQTPESTQAQREFHDFLLNHLTENPGLGYRNTGNLLLHDGESLSWDCADGSLWQASTWVAEDLCILENLRSNYTMTAASVCSPSNWHLEEKIGRSVDFIHNPVPGYDSVLSERVNRFLHGLRSGRVMLRYNWSIQQGNELCWRDEQSPTLNLLDAKSCEYYWRVERQTFLRLPDSGAIVFGIRIFLHSFESLRMEKGFDESLKRLLSLLPDAEKRYKSLD